MGILINKEDFVNTFALSKGVEDSIDAYIVQYEESILVELLGAELFKLFKADLASQVPQDAIYLSIYNAISEDDSSCVRRSLGMKSLLLGMIWFEYVRIEIVEHTSTGLKLNDSEISRSSTNPQFVIKRYNESINDVETIQWYIQDNLSDYPTYNGQKIKRILF
jgi:hypothetical protein